MGRDEAARAIGVKRAVAAFHLDKLAEEGLLEADYKRLSGRSGPGAGRPAKVYRRSTRELEFSAPHREYRLAACLFAEALNDERAPRHLDEVARSFGKELAEDARRRAGRRQGVKNLTAAAREVLRDYGFEPFRDEGGTLRLRNCPFHALARRFTGLMCGMNLEIMRAMVEELGLERLDARLEPLPDGCCVAFDRV